MELQSVVGTSCASPEWTIHIVPDRYKLKSSKNFKYIGSIARIRLNFFKKSSDLVRK
jgi:hypothetical protein